MKIMTQPIFHIKILLIALKKTPDYRYELQLKF